MLPVKIRFAHYTFPFLDIPPEPDYYVVSGEIPGKLRPGMNICAEQIQEAGLPIPLTPTYKTYLSLMGQKKRCGRCWAALRGVADLSHHFETNVYCQKWYEQRGAK